MAENKTNKKIWLASPHMSDEGYEMQYVQEAFDTNWVAPLGPNVNEFENELAAKVGSKHAAALNSGTGAIHLALKAAGVGEGDVGRHRRSKVGWIAGQAGTAFQGPVMTRQKNRCRPGRRRILPTACDAAAKHPAHWMNRHTAFVG